MRTRAQDTDFQGGNQMMNKRIISLILAMLMLTGVLFTGCGSLGGGEGTDPGATEPPIDDSGSAMTLSMYVVSEEPVSEATAKSVEEAFNRITKVNFKTQVKLHFATYDEYYDVIESVVESNLQNRLLEEEATKAFKKAKKDAKAEGIVVDDAWEDQYYLDHPEYAPFRETEELTGDDTTAEQTEQVTIDGIDSSYTLSQLKYPDERPHQIDILWIDSYERYIDYIEREMIERLDSEINGSSKKLTEYINGELLTWAKWVGSGTFGIPNNVIIGEYTYLLVNKELATKYSYNPETLDSLADCADFLSDVAKYETNVVPVLGKLYPTNTYYWNIDTTTGAINSDKFSILAGTTLNRTHDPSSKANVYLGCNNIFKSTDYTDQLKTIQKYKDAGYIVNETEGTEPEFAVRMIKGDASLEAVYGDKYELNVLEYPRVGYEEVFSSMFAVSSYTRSLPRSMQIITYLNTNSDLRNILQYGVEGVHYKIDDETGRVVRLNRDYIMDITRTGNVFMAYPEEYMSEDVWEWGKKQNREALPFLTLGFDFSSRVSVPEEEDAETYLLINKKNIDLINSKSAEVYEFIENCESLEVLEAKIAEWAAIEDEDGMEAFKKEKSSAEYEPQRNPIPGFYHYYYQWLVDTGLFVEINE